MAGVDYFAETINKGEAFPKHPEKTSLGHLGDEVQAAGTVDIAFAGGEFLKGGYRNFLLFFHRSRWT